MLHLRESAQRMGLLRKHRGHLLVTAQGKAARGDPAAPWFQLAERMPLTSKDLCEEQAGLLYLIAVAAGEDDPTGSSPKCSMTSAGGTGRHTNHEVVGGGRRGSTKDVLRRLRLLGRGRV